MDKTTTWSGETVNEGLQRIIYRVVDGVPVILAASRALTPEQSARWRVAITLDPLPAETAAQTLSIGIFALTDDHFLLARTHLDADGQPLQEVVALNRADLNALSGSIKLLVEYLFYEPIPAIRLEAEPDFIANTPLTIDPYPMPMIPTWTFDRRLVAFTHLYNHYTRGDITPILILLGAILQDNGLLIRGFVAETAARVEFVQSLMMLLPSLARADLTFSTQAQTAIPAPNPRLIFSDGAATGGRWVADFSDPSALQLPDLDAVRSPYIECLAVIWEDGNGDPRAFVTELRAMELINQGEAQANGVRFTLNDLAQRYLQDRHVLAGGDLPLDQVLAAFAQGNFSSPEIRARYAQLLLYHALETRDADVTLNVAHMMDTDPTLDKLLGQVLEDLLDSEPDAVYFLARTRLVQGIDARWLVRLQSAAIWSLKIAISDSDTETLSHWLRLIVREPVAYQLGDILQQGILAAQPRTYTDGAFGYQLLQFAARRAPASLETLLDDPDLIAALPHTVAGALRDYQPEALHVLLTQNRALYLVAIGRALSDAPNPTQVLTPEIIEQLWALYAEEPAAHLPERYQPPVLIDYLLGDGLPLLAPDALSRLLTLMLLHQEDERFSEARLYDVIRRTIEADTMPLAAALHHSNLSADAILTRVGGAMSAGAMTQQQMVNVHLALLDAKGWQRGMLPLAEQVARGVQQNHALSLPLDRVWRLLQMAEEARSEQVARVMSKRLTADFERVEGERELSDLLQRLLEQLHWSPTARGWVLNWWRDFARQQPLVRLQQLEKVLDGRKPLEDARDIVQTTLGLRRVLGKRTLEDFADSIGTAFTVLQALSDAFDPAPKQPVNIDQATLRAELDARSAELTPDERRVLAKNLKELSGLISEMSENRSRASLMRREDDIDRQLMTGEQEPQSAIDLLKWFSGYWDGAQAHTKDDTK